MKTKIIFFSLLVSLSFICFSELTHDKLKGDYWILPSLECIYDKDIHYYRKDPFSSLPPYSLMEKYPDIEYYQIIYYRLVLDLTTGRYKYIPFAKEPILKYTKTRTNMYLYYPYAITGIHR